MVILCEWGFSRALRQDGDSALGEGDFLGGPNPVLQGYRFPQLLCLGSCWFFKLLQSIGEGCTIDNIETP